MVKFVKMNQDDDVLFAKFGTLGKADKKSTYLVKENEVLEGVITEIKDSDLYGKVLKLRIKQTEKPIIVLGKTNLLEQMGFGQTVTPLIAKVNDIIRITYLGTTTTKKKYTFYRFNVEIAEGE